MMGTHQMAPAVWSSLEIWNEAKINKTDVSNRAKIYKTHIILGVMDKNDTYQLSTHNSYMLPTHNVVAIF